MSAHVAQFTGIIVGNFDGVHRGHTELINCARREVGARGRVVVLAFDPNPLTILRPETVPPRLTTWEQRARLLSERGADEVVRLNPTPALLNQTAEAFIAWCVEQWRPSVIVEGSDFRFGRGRAGSIATLRDLEQRFGYRTVEVQPVDIKLGDQSQVRASSSIVRWLLERGRVQDATRVLSREYAIEGQVVRGDQRGRTLGFATANLGPIAQMLPGDGVYAGVATRDNGAGMPAAISVGCKPTFGEGGRACEAHILDYDGPVNDYGWLMTVRFTRWLRDQMRYDDVEALVSQIRRDIANVRLAPRAERVLPGAGRA